MRACVFALVAICMQINHKYVCMHAYAHCVNVCNPILRFSP